MTTERGAADLCLDPEPDSDVPRGEDVNHTEELAAIVSDLDAARTSRDASGVSRAVTRLLAWLKGFDRESLVAQHARQALAAGWLLTKCAENLRELEGHMTTTKWQEVGRTTDLAERCVVRFSEAVAA
jgi:hypothetical protein